MENEILTYDLSNCDKEPIHLIGKIQDVGSMLAISKDYKIKFVSKNIKSVFNMPPEDLFDRDIKTLLNDKLVAALEEFVDSNKYHYSYKRIILIHNTRYQIFFANAVDYILLEFQEIKDINEFYNGVSDGFRFIDDAMGIFSVYENESDLAANACVLLRQYIGFDKVMVYKFDENDDGEVIGEDRAEGIKPYFGLKFPASDIPKQARQLYLTNKVRAINDSYDDGIDIITNDQNINVNNLDLTYSIFRSVSPIHLQYLRNMDVKASHSISIIINNRLWGLILCHNYTEAKFLTINQRLNTQIFGDLFSNRISIIESQSQFEDTKLLNSLSNDLRFNNKSLYDTISELWQPLSTLFKSNGAFYRENNHDFSINETLNKIHIEEIDKLFADNNDSVVFTESLNSRGYKYVDEFPYSGILRLTISEEENKYFYLFRNEKVKNVKWAGDPNKKVEVDANDLSNIGPRKSFESWTERVRHFSERWTPFEISCSQIIKDALSRFDIDSNKSNNKTSENYDIQKQRLELAINKKTHQLELHHKRLIQEIEHNAEMSELLKDAKKMSDSVEETQNDLFTELSKLLKTPINNFSELRKHFNNSSFTDEVNNIIDHHLGVTNVMIETINKLIEVSKFKENEQENTNTRIELINLREEISNKIKKLD